MIRILINSLAGAGVDKYRISQPHNLLQELFPDEFEITYNNTDLSDNLDYIKEFDIIFFHKLPIVNSNPINYNACLIFGNFPWSCCVRGCLQRCYKAWYKELGIFGYLGLYATISGICHAECWKGCTTKNVPY